MAVELSSDRLACFEVVRFPNAPVRANGTVHWDIQRLYRGVLDGLRAAGPVSSVGVDSWAVDYGLLDANGVLLEDPVHYRDARTDGIAAALGERLPPAELYAVTGVQVLPFNTIYQLVAALGTPALDAARQLLLVPDLLAYWLTGHRVAELTNASTTGLLDVRTRSWSDEVAARAGIRSSLFASLVEPGHPIGPLDANIAQQCGQAGSVQVTAVGSHDTASAIAGVPAEGTNFAYVATGTWSLVGVELAEPVLTEASRLANFSNELGIDGTVRYLRNVMGLWLLQECMTAWGGPPIEPLLAAAAAESSLRCVVDAGSTAFIAPGAMPERVAAAAVSTGQPAPQSRAATVRCILDSLALAHREAVRQASALSGQPIDVVHIVGGGVRNALLCQLTADACGLPVLAGPAEAAALGNAMVQGRAMRSLGGGLPELREWLRGRVEVVRYEPGGDQAGWDAAERLVLSSRGA